MNKHKSNLSGIFTALVTPFNGDGSFDLKSYYNLLNLQLNSKVSGIVINGTTSESQTLYNDERLECLDRVKEDPKYKALKVIYGIGTNNTEDALYQLRELQNRDLRPDYIMVSVPFYNRPSEEGIYAHFRAICQESKLPIIIYNVPKRSGSSIEIDTVIKLAKTFKNIVGIKDATANTKRCLDLNNAMNDLDKDFSILSGDDDMFLHYMLSNAQGIISVSSNVIPDKMVYIYNSWIHRNNQRAIDAFNSHIDFFNLMFIENSPAPAKYALSLLGMCNETVRLPIFKCSEESKNLILSKMVDLQIIKP